MYIYAKIEIDSKGIMKQVEKTKSAIFKMRQETDKLVDMLNSAKVEEIGDPEEPPIQD